MRLFIPDLRRVPRDGRAGLVIGLLVATVSCGGGGSPTSPSTPGAPALACAASIEATSPDGNPVTVTFTNPVASNGSPPVNVSCTPATNTLFQVGTTTVNCTATDNTGRTASCQMPIVVKAAPRLQYTKYMAFGDSMTEGEISLNLRLVLDPSRSYPTDLLARLSTDYPTQSFTVINKGVSGEGAAAGAKRISSELERNQPEVLLLLQGANDLNLLGENEDVAIATVLDALKYDIRDARRRGVEVIISTLLPQRRCGRAYYSELVAPTNDKIFDLAARENVTLADAWQAFRGREDTLIGEDCLHPTAEGYQELSRVFYDAIVKAYAVRPTTVTPSLQLRKR